MMDKGKNDSVMGTSVTLALADDFTHLKREYRKILKHYCKITYREGQSKIYIIRVFDTRQDPKKNR